MPTDQGPGKGHPHVPSRKGGPSTSQAGPPSCQPSAVGVLPFLWVEMAAHPSRPLKGEHTGPLTGPLPQGTRASVFF